MLFDSDLLDSVWSPLPKFLQNKKAIDNVQNEDDRFFGYAIASARHPVEKHFVRQKMYSKCFEDEGLDDIEFLVNPVDIPLLEERLNISINLFTTTLTILEKLGTKCTSVGT